MNSRSVCLMTEVSCVRLVLIIVAQFVEGRLGLPLASLGKNPSIRIHPHALPIRGKDRIRDQSLALNFNGFFARLNNSVIRGTNTVPRKFKRDSVLKSSSVVISWDS
jgi:hypothetical protein